MRSEQKKLLFSSNLCFSYPMISVSASISKIHFLAPHSWGYTPIYNVDKTQCLVNVHSCVHETAPCPIRNLVQLERNVSRFNLRSNEQNPLNIVAPITKSRISSQSFSAKGPAFWNVLPTELRRIERKTTFKNTVKRKMLSEYTAVSECHNPRCTDRRHHHH